MEKTYIPTIGLEVHAELHTNTKMFCNSKNDPDEKLPNVNVCPVCMGHPGTLPVINKKAVEHIVRIGTALGGTVADHTFFDRKNYFYPDIPKGYQISQYKHPIISGGELAGVAITRVHLEEDTARSTHDKSEKTLVDFNRAGIPLMELVTEPVIKTADHAAFFARELQLMLRYLGAGNANMEKGEMRVEANISVSDDPNKFGTKVEIKNLNSFRVVEKAIAYEIARQSEVLNRGEKVVQETRGWDEQKEVTFSQRIKEDSHDYRYFPEPDLPSLQLNEIPEFSRAEVNKTLPELPWQKRARYKELFKIKDEDAELYIQDRTLGSFFENAVRHFHTNHGIIQLASNYLTSDVLGLLKKTPADITETRVGKLDEADFAELVLMVQNGEVSSRGAKELLPIIIYEGGKVRDVARTKELFQQSNETVLRPIVEKVISVNGAVVQEYKGGKVAVLSFLVGQAMKESGGNANPQVLTKLFTELIK
jgi:aspartyl-tRNA(Asn)/glutamyl-tRNA(Gln) amidotransferase subunit B